MLLFLPVAFGQLADMSKQIILLMEKLFLWLFITYSLQYRESSIQDVVTQSNWTGACCSGMYSSFFPVCPVSCSEEVIKMDMTEYMGGLHCAFRNWVLLNSCPSSYEIFIYKCKNSIKRKKKESPKPLPKLKAWH